MDPPRLDSCTQESRPNPEEDIVASFTYVGQPTPRLDTPAKVTGEAQYTADLQLPRMLHAKVLRSPVAHALIKRIDTSKARAHPGVVTVVTAGDLPAKHLNPSTRAHMMLADREVLYYGQAVAAVVAQTLWQAEEALDLIEVEYEPLPVVIDPIEAMKPDSPLTRTPLKEADRSEEREHSAAAATAEVEDKAVSNVSSHISITRGDVAVGFGEADLVVEQRYRVGMVHQGYIEPHVAVADYDTVGNLHVWTSTQGQFSVRSELARVYGLPENRVNVMGMESGGGFGGKMFNSQLLPAGLSMLLRRPVKLAWTRSEDLKSAVPAPQAIIELRTGVKKDGTLTALDAKVIIDSGCFPGGPMTSVCMLVGGYYRFPNLNIEGFEVVTNKVSVGAYRAPGAPQATFAIESQMDAMAKALGLDPIEFRLKNAVKEGDLLPNGRPYPRIGAVECLEAIQKSSLWQRRKAGELGPNRAVNMALSGWLGGSGSSAAEVLLNPDGTMAVEVGTTDITGVTTSFAQIAAEVLQLPLDRVGVRTGDTASMPYSGVSAGSRTTYSTGNAVLAAAKDAREQLLTIGANRLEVPKDDLDMSGGRIFSKSDPSKALTFADIGRLSTGFGGAYIPVIGRGLVNIRRQAPGFTVQAVEVEVDPETGFVKVIDGVVAQDVGKAINPLAVEGQMQGGLMQGLGIGLWEEMVYDREGILRNPTLLDYRQPTAMDIPPFETILVEVPNPEGPFGARIVGEPAIGPGAAAVANAIHDATGVRVTTTPITAERLLHAMGKLQEWERE